eukprot:4292489-Amphidinium_carterae.2
MQVDAMTRTRPAACMSAPACRPKPKAYKSQPLQKNSTKAFMRKWLIELSEAIDDKIMSCLALKFFFKGRHAWPLR